MSTFRIHETCYKREPGVVTINLNKKDLREYLIEHYDLTRLKGNVYIPKSPRNDKIMAVKFFNKNKKLANIQQEANKLKHSQSVINTNSNGRAIVYKNRT